MSSPMNKSSISRVINEYVSVSNERKALEKREKELKEIILSLGESPVASAKYTITTSVFVRKILDKKSIEAEMGEEWVAEHQKDVLGTRLNVKAN